MSIELKTAAQQAEAQQPATGEPALFIHPDTFAMNNAHVGAWKPGHELPGYIPLYTRPAPSVPDDVVRDAERYRWLRDNWFTMGASYPEDTVKFHLGNARWSEQPESNLDAAIDAAMLADS